MHGFQFKYVTSRAEIIEGVDKTFISQKELEYKKKVIYISEIKPNKINKKMIYKGCNIGMWLCKQRTDFRKKKISEEKLLMWNEFGVTEYLTQ